MAQSSAAAVIDLEELRRREARARPRQGPARSSPSMLPAPRWIVRTPVWFVG